MLDDIDNLSVETACIIHRRTSPSWDIPERYIPNYEIVLVTEGTGKVCLDGAEHILVPGDLIFLNPDIKNSFSLIDGALLDIYCVHFTTKNYPDTLPIPKITNFESYERLLSIFKMLYDSNQEHDYLAKWHKNLLLQQLIFEIFTLLKSRTEPIKSVRIRKIMNYIQSDPYRNITISELTRKFSLQKTALMELFKDTMGMTPGQYICSLKMQNAQKFLLETDLPISLIAENCGFSDSFYFSRCFKKHFSLSPSLYRETYR